MAVCDGFTGNVMLKLTEGLAKMFNGELKKMFSASFKSKLGAALLMDEIKVFKKKFDASEQGGALMLGAKKPVIKAHGNSDARAIKNAIRQAVSCVEKNIVGEIESVLEQLASDGNNG